MPTPIERKRIINSYNNPYKDNLGDRICSILKTDAEYVCSAFSEVNLRFLIAFTGVMLISLIKVIAYTIEWLGKPSEPKPDIKRIFPLSRNYVNQLNDESDIINVNVEIQSNAGTLEDLYMSDKRIKDNYSKLLNDFRLYLYKNNLELHAEILKTINHHNVSEEDLVTYMHTGEVTRPYSTTHITFGDDINHTLKRIIGNKIKLKENRLTKETYILIYNDELHMIKEELQKIYNEPIKVKFD